MISQKTARILVAEFAGTMILLATVIGSGIMADRLAGGNVAIALLGNTIPTGAILYVLITVFGPVSGAHFNPAVTIAFLLRREIAFTRAAHFMFVQVAGAICGAMLAHFMFEVPLLQLSQNVRTGPAQWGSEFVATFGLLTVIFGGLRWRPDAVPALVGMISPPPTGSPPRLVSPIRRSPSRAPSPTASPASCRPMFRPSSSRSWRRRSPGPMCLAGCSPRKTHQARSDLRVMNLIV